MHTKFPGTRFFDPRIRRGISLSFVCLSKFFFCILAFPLCASQCWTMRGGPTPAPIPEWRRGVTRSTCTFVNGRARSNHSKPSYSSVSLPVYWHEHVLGSSTYCFYPLFAHDSSQYFVLFRWASIASSPPAPTAHQSTRIRHSFPAHEFLDSYPRHHSHLYVHSSHAVSHERADCWR
jgi:hypothetical protein